MGKIIRDAVHGDIQMTGLELEIIDTPEFQRLRGIKQLGTAYLIYPSAVHTRFEHSLGTAWMAQRLIDAIRQTGSVSEDDARRIRLVSLLHDITHIPFGHTLEDERRVLPRHDKDESRLTYFLRASTIGKILEREGLREGVIRVLTGHGSLESDIVSGSISADLLDYLRRDNYFCGLSQDYDFRLLSSFTVIDDRMVVNLEKHGELRRDALSELIHLLRIRYVLSERVYFHHTKASSGAMISKAVELALRDGLRPESLRTLRDETLMWVLREQYGVRNPSILRFVDALGRRSLYKPCLTVSLEIDDPRRAELVRQFHEDEDARERAEKEIARLAGVAPDQIIVYCPSARMSLPEADVLVRVPGGKVLPLAELRNPEIEVLRQKHQQLWKFYVLLDREASGRRDRVTSAARELLGLR